MITNDMIIKTKENVKKRFEIQSKYPLTERELYQSEKGVYVPGNPSDHLVDGWGRYMGPEIIKYDKRGQRWKLDV